MSIYRVARFLDRPKNRLESESPGERFVLRPIILTILPTVAIGGEYKFLSRFRVQCNVIRKTKELECFSKYNDPADKQPLEC